ncbi:MAG: anaerobic ribonucleoside-triphosphate reductase-activating protein [Succinivibrionaceae bacterium]
MNYSKYIPIDVLNGRGTRCTLFVSGCIHQCKGCYNQSTWSVNAGFPFTDELLDTIITDLNNVKVPRRGLSLTGGDPLLPQNLETVKKICEKIRAECSPEKDIWMWTGYTLEELTKEQLEVVDYVDVLIDGKFVQELKVLKEFRGSSNQVIHHFNRSQAYWRKK